MKTEDSVHLHMYMYIIQRHHIFPLRGAGREATKGGGGGGGREGLIVLYRKCQ